MLQWEMNAPVGAGSIVVCVLEKAQ
jgi:hypothetical protein